MVKFCSHFVQLSVEELLQIKGAIYSCVGECSSRPVKAKFHNQLRTSSEPTSVMEFGFKPLSPWVDLP